MMRLSELNRFRRSHWAGTSRRVPTGGGDLLAAVGLMALLLLLTRIVALATDAFVRLIGG